MAVPAPPPHVPPWLRDPSAQDKGAPSGELPLNAKLAVTRLQLLQALWE